MSGTPGPTIWWLRRDLRLADNPALLAAVDGGGPVLPLFVLDPTLLRTAGAARRRWLAAALTALDADLRAGAPRASRRARPSDRRASLRAPPSDRPGLSVVTGRPVEVLPRVAAAVGAVTVHTAADFGPYGRRRDGQVARALAELGVRLQATGSAYGVAPGALLTGSGRPYAVFTPYHRAWADRGVHPPAPAVDPATVSWLAAPEREPPAAPHPGLVGVAGEGPARAAWRAWRQRDAAGVGDYADLHDVPGSDATAHVSVALRWGHLHPRTLLADLAEDPGPGAAAFARQLVWRDFYADVLWHRPEASRSPVRPGFDQVAVDQPDPGTVAAERLHAWQSGRTGYPLVDAGMRQLLTEGWMHNRVRMVTASFCVHDLHLPWPVGADWSWRHLLDGDLASNQLNWQWVAGCGMDPARFFRVFNPTSSGQKFDADGSYVRRYVPELAEVPVEHLHEPWRLPGGPPDGYPAPVVDHAAERRDALRRYAVLERRPG